MLHRRCTPWGGSFHKASTSDALILLGQANKWQPAAAGIWIMTLYILALLLLTVGVLGRSNTPNRPLAQRL